MKRRVGIVGFRGYSGAELLRILKRHRHVEVCLLEHRSEAEEPPRIRGESRPPRLPLTPETVREHRLALVFLATPPEVSLELAPALLEAGARVIDLSGAFRLRLPETYRRWYRSEHTQPGLLAEAVYGLPEFCREQIRHARLVANPGCYPTAASLAIRPLVDAGVVDRYAGIICDAKSGVSGAGRKPTLRTSFCEVTENLTAYSILEHRHVPEILLNCELEEGELSFTAQLVPVDRGILETIYFRGLEVSGPEMLLHIYEQRYGQEPFIRLYEPGQTPDLHAVQHTNFCDLGVVFDAGTGRGVVVAAIDNLVKGAAGQAVQNMNLMLGFAETEALL